MLFRYFSCKIVQWRKRELLFKIDILKGKSYTSGSIIRSHFIILLTEEQCDALDVPNHAIFSGPCNPPYDQGKLCILECEPGYVRTSGKPRRVCAHGGEWLGTPIVCEGNNALCFIFSLSRLQFDFSSVPFRFSFHIS